MAVLAFCAILNGATRIHITVHNSGVQEDISKTLQSKSANWQLSGKCCLVWPIPVYVATYKWQGQRCKKECIHPACCQQDGSNHTHIYTWKHNHLPQLSKRLDFPNFTSEHLRKKWTLSQPFDTCPALVLQFWQKWDWIFIIIASGVSLFLTHFCFLL